MKSIPVAEPLLGDLEAEAVLDCIRSGWISSNGKYVEEFERKFAEFCGTAFGISASNGTAALHLAVAALGIGRGDEVIVPSLTFAATANAVLYTGATPIFVDVDPNTWCMDPGAVESAVTERTKAIIPVHLYGHPADMQAICNIAQRRNLAVIEDAAEAHGAEIEGRRVGSFGTVSCFSFFANKIFTTGEGGMATTDVPELASRMRQLREHGMDAKRRYWHPVVGYNYRMTNIQAALGVAQLSRATYVLTRKREIARRYSDLLSGNLAVSLAPEAPWARSVFWMYSVLLDGHEPDRERVSRHLAAEGIETRPFFYPLHTMPPYMSQVSLPVTESLSRRGLNLPSSVTLTDGDIERVARTLTEALRV